MAWHEGRHPMGDATRTSLVSQNGASVLDMFGGRIPVEWDPVTAVTPLGPACLRAPHRQVPFCIELLTVCGLFEAWVADCPLSYTSHHASEQCAGLATDLLALRAGPHRDAAIPAIGHTGIHPERWGVEKRVSDDAAPVRSLAGGRRALARREEPAVGP